MRPEPRSSHCSVCAELGAYVEIDNAQEPNETDVSQSFPDAVLRLHVPNDGLERHYRYANARLLKCDQCGTYYWYRTWAPGGSEDVMRTYIHEAVRRLSDLEAYVELDQARYDAQERVQEMGGLFADDHEAARQGAEREMAVLQGHRLEVVVDALDAIADRYQYTRDKAEALALYAPGRDHTKDLEEAREKDENVAAYHARILALYLPGVGAAAMPGELVRSLCGLLGDANQAIRETIRDALLQALGRGNAAPTLAAQILGSLEGQESLPPEAETVVAACRDALSGRDA